MSEIKLVKVIALKAVNLAGREHSDDAPAKFSQGESGTTDEATALANPHFFKIVEQ
jgi:hypothetical protein